MYYNITVCFFKLLNKYYCIYGVVVAQSEGDAGKWRVRGSRLKQCGQNLGGVTLKLRYPTLNGHPYAPGLGSTPLPMTPKGIKWLRKERKGN